MKKISFLIIAFTIGINLININPAMSFSLPGDFILTAKPGCVNSQPRMNLSWTASPGADTYDVYKNGKLIVSGLTGLAYNAPNLVTGVNYTFYIKAKNIDGSTNSNLANVIGSNCTPGALVGVKKIGPSGNFKTITAALNALQVKGYSNSVILEIQSDYSSVEEIFPISFTSLNTSDVFPLTIRPESGGTNLNIVCDSSNKGTINFTEARNVIIDGQFSNDGNKWLKFGHSNPDTNSVIQFQNNSHNIIVKNCLIEGATGSNAGNVKFSTSISDGTGNSFITLDHNKIGSVSFSAAVIYSVGSSNAPNHDNTITNNEIFNFRGSMDGSQAYAAGIYAYGTGNGDNWNISNNSIYNTTNAGSNGQTAIYFLTGSNGNTISDNFIGGNAANATGQWENSVNGFEHYGMNVNVGSVTIKGNTFQNIYMSGFSTSAFVCIDLYGGVAEISNNNFGGTSGNFIQVNGGGTRNIFGPLGNPGFVMGVRSTTSSALTVSNNHFNNLYAFGGNDNRYYGGYIRAISHTGSGKFIITGNSVVGPQGTAVTNSQYAVYVSNTSLVSAVTDCIVSNNDIQGPWPVIDLARGTTGGIRNIGVFIAGKFSGVISKNKIYNMYNGQLGTGTHGIQLNSNDAGTWTISNNQISFGNNGPGYGVKYGILDQTSAGATINVFYNSVYISGTEASTNSSAAFRRVSSTDGSALTLKNNILINSRKGGNTSVAIANEGVGFAVGWNSDNNFLASIGADSLGLWNTTTSNFANWKTNSGGDIKSTAALATTAGNSSSTNVVPSELFVNPDNNLHIILAPPASPYPYLFLLGKGVAVSIKDDIDGEKRPSGTSIPDIGADEFITNCGVPESINSLNVTSTKETISWANNPGAVSYRIQYRVTGGGTWSVRIVNAPKTSVTLTNLLSNTTYEYEIRTNCNQEGSLHSDFSSIQNFTTLCDCALPTNLSATGIDANSVRADWVGNTCAVRYALQYRLQGTNKWTTKFINAPLQSYIITGLTFSVIYEYRLRSECNISGTIHSGWTAISLFSTASASRNEERADQYNAGDFSIIPNPNKGNFEIYFSNPASNSQVQIFNSIGQKVFAQSSVINKNSMKVSLNNLPDGIYFVQMLTNEGTKTEKIVVQK